MCGFCRITDLGISHFNFFKQKLKLKSIYMFGASCSSGYTEHNKIEFAFFGFFYDFIWILQDPAQIHKRGKKHFSRRPLERSGGSQLGPWFAQNTPKLLGALQCSPW
jgi:hypothetical protein